MKNLYKIFMCFGLLIGVSFGCSKGDIPYQFAMDAVANKPEFAKDKKHWVWQFSHSKDTTKMSQTDINHDVFLSGVLPKNNNSLLPKEGEVVVCWQDKDKKVYLSIFDPQSQTERLIAPLTAATECSEGPM